MTSFTKSLIIIGVILVVLVFTAIASTGGVGGKSFYRQEKSESRKKCPVELLNEHGDCVYKNRRYEYIIEDSTVLTETEPPKKTNFVIIEKPVYTDSDDEDDTDDDYDRGYYGGSYSGGSTNSGK